jgi:MFS family permease
MKTFMTIWIGQLLSLFGSSLTTFALGVWVFQETESVTQFTLVLFFGSIPGVLLLPFAGLLADRWDRRRTMMLSDAGAALGTVVLAVMFFIGTVQIWLIYAALVVSSSLGTFQRPAYSAAIAQLVDEEHFGRANGMVQTAQAVAQLLAPLAAGVMLAFVDIRTILVVDLMTFGCALATLAWVRFPPIRDAVVEESQPGWLREIIVGWRYLGAHAGLLSLMVFFAVLNFSGGFANALVQPLILSFTTASMLGTVMTLGGLGLLVGSLVMSAWGGPKRRVNGIFGFMLLAGVGIFAVGFRPSVPLVTAALFVTFFTLPFVQGCTSAIVQSKVKPRLQGRVFAVTHMIAGFMAPVAYLLAGPLADRVFEPLMAPGGALADSVGAVIGVGPGRGIALLMMTVGVVLVLATAGGYLVPRLRRVEDEMPDAGVPMAEAAGGTGQTIVDPARSPGSAS